jgi:hypothetical protein
MQTAIAQRETPLQDKIYGSKKFKEIEAEARINIDGMTFKTSEAVNSELEEKVNEYEKTKEYLLSLDIDDQKELFAVIKRIKSEAISIILEEGKYNESQLKRINLTEEDILFEAEVRRLLADHLKDEFTGSKVIRRGYRLTAKKGHIVDYSALNDLKVNKDSYGKLRKKMFKEAFDNVLHKEKYDRFGNEIDYTVRTRGETLKKDTDEEKPEPLTLYDVNYRISELKKEIIQEKRARSKERSKLENLCFHILYYVIIESEGGKAHFRRVTDRRTVLDRIRRLSKSDLKKMIRFAYRLKNQYSDEPIQAKRKKKRLKKEYSATEKKAIILKHKAEGKKQSEVVKITGWSLTTVKGYWK